MITQKKYLHSQLLCDDNYPNIMIKYTPALPDENET